MLRDVAGNSSHADLLSTGNSVDVVENPAPRRVSSSKRSLSILYRRVTVALLLLLLAWVSVPILVSANALDEQPPVDVLPEGALKGVTSFSSDGTTPSIGGEVALQYTFGGSNLVLVLSDNGVLHAYNLERGELAWSTDIGGDMVSVEVDVPPSRDTILRDPLALPFLVRGNSLFTRIPFSTDNPAPTSTLDTTELLGNLPDVLRPYFFMNISTLLRRQGVFFGGTDVLVTTSVEVADLDSSTGHHVSLQRRGHRRGGSQRNVHAVGQNTSSSLPNELQPILHLVRYNIVLHVMKPGEYSWSITLSQLQLSPRTSFAATARRAVEVATKSAAKEHNDEANPRFFSHVMRDLFDYDATHADSSSRRGQRHQRQQHRPAKAARESSEDAGELPAEAAAKALVDALERRRTLVAEYVSRVLSIRQHNKSHVQLHNLLDDSIKWTATLPSSSRSSPFSASSDHFVGEDVASVSTSLTSVQAIAAYVWVRGAEQVFRIPVQRTLDDSVWQEEDKGSAGEENEGAGHTGVYVESHPDTAGEAKRRLWLTPATLAGAVVSAQGTLAELPLVPFRLRSADSAMRHADLAMDVEGDEREGAELDRYYHERSWWESHLLSSPPSASPVTDHPFASFSSPSDGIRTGLAWRTAGIISFHVLCLAGSIAFLCAGVPPRNQLQRAWVQADRNRDRLSHTSISRPQSTQLVPQDMMNNGVLSPFSPVIDGFSVDAPMQSDLDAVAKARSQSPARADAATPEASGEVDGDSFKAETQHSATGPMHKWDDRTPEEVYAMMREDSEVQALEFAGTGCTTASGKNGKVLSSSVATHQSRQSAATCAPPVEACSRSTAEDKRVVDKASSDNSNNDEDGDDDDDDSEEIDLGERWWVRAQHRPRLPSVATLDEMLSDHASSVSFSPVHDGAEEEGKLFQLHFKVLEKVGFGGEGSVFCVEHRVTHARYAIKAIHIHEQDEERVVQEAVLHSSFDNANVVRFYFCWIEDIAVSTADRLQLCTAGEDGLDTASMGFSDRSLTVSSSADDKFTDEDRDASMVGDTYHMLFIQMEYFPRGTLADWLRSRKGFYRLEVLHYMQNIADGLAYLHNQDVVHRDLKPTNIFVSNANVLKIGDFGLAKRRVATAVSTGDLASNVVGAQQERSIVGGSPLYCSPEQTRGDPVNKPSDIFSFGIIAVEMLCTFATLHERIRILTDAHQGVLPEELERDFPEEAQLVKQLLASEPQQRPSLRKVQRQLMRLVDALEASDQDTEDLPHSPAETVEPSQLSPHAGGLHGHATRATPTHRKAEKAELATVAVFASNKSPLLRSFTASSFSASTRAAATNSTRRLTAATSSSPLSETPPTETLSVDGHASNEEEEEAQPLPEWQRTAAAASPSSGTPQEEQEQQQQQLLLHHSVRRASASSTHSASASKQRNSYHDRRYASASSTPGAERTAGSSSAETASQGGRSSASPAELIVNDPYGPPATPVTYVEDADLSTIVKRDLQDRTISPPD